LRDFYARRDEPQTTVVRSEPKQPAVEEQAEALKLKKQGNDLYASGDYEGSLEFYSTAIKQAPSSILHANRAAAYMMLGWWDQAARDTKIALRKDPNNEKARERHGKVLLAQDNLDGALQIAKEMEARIPEEEKRNMKKLPQNVRRLQWLAQNAKDPGTLDECRAILAEFGTTKAELVSPLGVRLRKRLVKALVDRSDAIDNQRKIRPALYKNQQSVKDGDEIQELTPFAEEAIKVTGELMADNFDDADVRYWRGRALVRLGRHADAEDQLKRGLNVDPEHGQTKELVETISEIENLKAKGNAFYKEGKLAEAIAMYTQGIERDPDCVDTRAVATLYYNRSAAYRKKGEFEQALEDVNTSLALNPRWAKALYRRGILLLECGRASEALTELKVVQRADPTFDDDLETWLRRAHNWMSKKPEEVNYYEFMRLPMDSSQDDVRKQYRRLCLVWHPDKNGGTEEGRQRFEDLQVAYKFLMDEEQREKYDFGIWKDRAVRHHVKTRTKVKDSYDQRKNMDDRRYDEGAMDPDAENRHLVEDDKVESIYWGDQGCPEWLQKKRQAYRRQRYGEDSD